MCGVFGFVIPGADIVPQNLAVRGVQALRTLDHRGPDQWDHCCIDGAFLGHTRLSVIDLSDAGRQPMASTDEKLYLTVNGEIYDYRRLRDEIGASKFRSQSDSEVFLHGYRAYGLNGLLEKIDGMYAGALLDRDTQQIVLFGDRVGIKPLYVAQGTCDGIKLLAWASELKAIRAFLDDLEIDPTAILDFAAQRCIPAPKTIYKQVSKLPPATSIQISLVDGKFQQHKYWTLPVGQVVRTVDDTTEHLRELIDRSVREQLVADVPVGLFLSGGLDSSVLCESAARHVPHINTYNVSFGIPERDEGPFARIVADACGTKHVEDHFSAEDAAHPFTQMNEWFDEPFGDLSAFPTARVCSVARRDSVVALSGDGGDELFGGYKWYYRYWQFRRFNRFMSSRNNLAIPYYRPPTSVWQKICNRIALLGHLDPLQLYAGITSNLLVAELNPIRQWLEVPEDYDYVWALRPHYRPELGRRRALQYLDFHTWLPNDLLTKVDRVSMAVSLEVRVPFLQRRLCEFAFSLPESFLYLGDTLKGGLKKAYEGHLPQSILDRDKQGFSLPVGSWDDSVLDGEPTFVYYYLKQLRESGIQAAVSTSKNAMATPTNLK